MSIPKRVAAIDVSHWHSAYDASYLRVLRDLGCDIIGVSDRSERIASDRAQRFGSRPFTDYRRMIEATKPEFVIALGRHCDMPDTFRFLVGAGVPFVMEKPWGTDAIPWPSSPALPPPRARGCRSRSCPATPSGQ